jgi:hypothetical protein
LLVLEVINSIAGVDGSRLPTEFAFRSNGLAGRANATYSIDRRQQLLTRRRIWEVQGDDAREDFVQFRMFFPMELCYYLTTHDFTPIGMYDNTGLGDSDLDGPYLFVVARYAGSGG